MSDKRVIDLLMSNNKNYADEYDKEIYKKSQEEYKLIMKNAQLFITENNLTDKINEAYNNYNKEIINKKVPKKTIEAFGLEWLYNYQKTLQDIIQYNEHFNQLKWHKQPPLDSVVSINNQDMKVSDIIVDNQDNITDIKNKIKKIDSFSDKQKDKSIVNDKNKFYEDEKMAEDREEVLNNIQQQNPGFFSNICNKITKPFTNISCCNTKNVNQGEMKL